MGDEPMNHAEWLHALAAVHRKQWEGWDPSIVGDTAERLDAAAKHIEQLEAELGRLRYFVATIDEHAEAISTEVPIALHPPIDVVKDGSIAYAAGHGPDDPPRPVQRHD